MILFYNEPDDDFEDRMNVEVSDNWLNPGQLEQKLLAQKCAEDLWYNHDGWDSSWPKTIILYESETGPELSRFEVEIETVPQFAATRL